MTIDLCMLDKKNLEDKTNSFCRDEKIHMEIVSKQGWMIIIGRSMNGTGVE